MCSARAMHPSHFLNCHHVCKASRLFYWNGENFVIATVLCWTYNIGHIFSFILEQNHRFINIASIVPNKAVVSKYLLSNFKSTTKFNFRLESRSRIGAASPGCIRAVYKPNPEWLKEGFPEPIILQEALAFPFWREWREQGFNTSPAAAISEGSELMIKLPTRQL